MNILRLSLATLTLATAANVQAGDDSAQTRLNPIAVRDNARLVVDCHDERRPSMPSVGAVLDTNNGSRIYAERERLLHIAHRECMRGVPRVAFVRDDSAVDAPALVMADAATGR